MSLTQDLRCNGPLAQFIDQQLNDLEVINTAWRTEVEEATTTAYPAGNEDSLGTAIEYAIGLDLCDSVPYRLRLEGLPQPEADRLLSGAGFTPPATAVDDYGLWTKQRDWDGPDTEQSDILVNLCTEVASFDALLRLPHLTAAMKQKALREFWNDDDRRPGELLINGHQYALPTWNTYLRHVRPAVKRLGRATAGVEFADGFAVADLICDSTLIDVKTQQSPLDCSEFVRQLVGYLLCDTEDQHHIQQLAIVLPRQGLLIQWSLEQILTPTAAANLASIRHDAADIIRDIQDAINRRNPTRSTTRSTQPG